MSSEGRHEPGSTAFADVTPAQWQRLAARRVFFGHQSVGENLVAGIRDVLAARPDIPLRVVDAKEPFDMAAPGFYHAAIGTNGAPATKLDAFQKIAGASLGDSGTAIMKYCYVDVTHQTNPDSLFEQYRRGVDSLRTAHPRMTIVHITLPLLTDGGTLVHIKNTLVGHPTGRALNAVRQRYNEHIRKTYGGREPVFDLAQLESMASNGKPAEVRFRGASIPVLAPEWTSDGGHLNEAGRRRMAEAFLATLASL